MSELNQDLLVALGELADEPVAQTGPTSDFVYIDIAGLVDGKGDRPGDGGGGNGDLAELVDETRGLVVGDGVGE